MEQPKPNRVDFIAIWISVRSEVTKRGYWFTIVLFDYFVIYILAEALLYKKDSTKGEMHVLAFMLFLSVGAFYNAGVSGTTICFTFFRIHARHFSQETWYGRGLQLIGRRTLNIYMIHYFVLQYDFVRPNIWLHYHDNTLFVPMALILALRVVIIILLNSNIFRVSPLLAK